MAIARYPQLLRSIARAKLLILDDGGPEQARDLLEIVEKRVLDRAAPHRSQERRAVAGPG
ncbi:DNA replication protein DnaC [Rhodoblastus acidophilus]|nr:DNA replication protein DnaC [Rhodoblastus acidophilus]